MLLISLFAIVLVASETHGAVIPVLGSQVSSSSVFTFGSTNYGPQLAVDGGLGTNFITDMTTFATATTDTAPYMDIDLGSNFLLRSVTITNRGDCCSERLRNIRIEVHDNNPTLGGTPQVCTTIGSPAPAAGSTTTFSCSGTPIGRYIRLNKFTKADANDILQLVEVVLDGVQLQCPCNHFQLDENCFYFSGFQTTYAQAKEYCNIIGSDLAMIRTQAQSDFVNGVLGANAQNGQEYWIGVTNLLDRVQWRYLLGDVVPLNSFTFPLVSGTGTCSSSTLTTHPENCAALGKNDAGQWVWDGEQCDSEEYFLCLGILPIPT
ncbi:fucolectin-5-like [Haliotis cracherodii]|uniref:fucolectin-5-like n=1 Tax=Haliotis cracherodii TaxID=6455 RepID=UPI0039ECD36E